MKLEGYRRLEAHVPTELWDEIEKARGQMTRSEFTRQALRAQLDYPSMVSGGTEKLAAPNGAKNVVPAAVAVPTVKDVKAAPIMKSAREILQERAEPDLPAKSAREILLERTRLMRGNGS